MKWNIEIMPARKTAFEDKPVRINWGAHGSVTIDETKDFIRVLQAVIKEAEQM